MAALKTSRLITLERYIDQEEDLHPQATGEFSAILHNFTFAIRILTREVRRAGLNDILGLTENINIHGENVRKLDEYANDTIKRTMSQGGNICVMASEEEDELIHVQPKNKPAKYILVFDPLDGSSNIDINITIGTIFSLYKRIDTNAEGPATLEDVLQPGYKQEAAGYALYGSSTLLVYTTGNGVNAFTYDPTLGEFLLTFEDIQMPKKSSYYSTNEGYYHSWDKNFQQYMDYIKIPSEDKLRPFTQRYVASGVADIHRTLHYGGIYLYPGKKEQPNGKLRLVYEANAWAFLVEQAGGRATDGNVRILEKKPKSIHERTPLFIGSKENVLECEMFLRGEHPWQKGNGHAN